MSIFLHSYRKQKLRVFASLVLLGGAVTAQAADETPKTGGTLIYLEQQAHTNLYPRPAGFIPTAAS